MAVTVVRLLTVTLNCEHMPDLLGSLDAFFINSAVDWCLKKHFFNDDGIRKVTCQVKMVSSSSDKYQQIVREKLQCYLWIRFGTCIEIDVDEQELLLGTLALLTGAISGIVAGFLLQLSDEEPTSLGSSTFSLGILGLSIFTAIKGSDALEEVGFDADLGGRIGVIKTIVLLYCSAIAIRWAALDHHLDEDENKRRHELF